MLPEDHQAPEGRGPRRAALEERRRAQRRHNFMTGGGAAFLLVIAVVIGAVVLADEPRSPEERPEATPSVAQGDPLTTILVFGTRERGGDEAVWISLLSLDSATGKGSVVYVPAHTAVQVPGRGLQALGDSLSSGGVPLLLVTAENLLGVEIDHHLDLSDGDARALFESVGDLSVDVPTEVRVRAGKDTARVVFTVGRQRLSSEFLVPLLYTIGVDGDDQELGSRHLAFWQAFFEAFGSDQQSLGRAVESSGGALAASDLAPEDIAGFLADLARLPEDDRRVTLLPVTQVSVGGDELYRADEEELRGFVAETIGSQAPTDDEIRVQVLNGNGVPGIGQAVARLLVGHGFKVVQSDNAQRFNYPETLIVTYDSSPQGQAAAERARELLGVGEVQVSAQQQGIVDLTIVVGKDFKG